MDFRDVTKLAMVEYKEAMEKALDGMTPAELRWQPSPNANHALWLAWHIARVEDGWLNGYVAEGEEVWTSGGWEQRLGLAAEGSGFGFSAEDVAAFPDMDIAEVAGYHDAVRSAALKVIDGLTGAELDKARENPRRRRQPTIAWVLGHVAIEEAQHVGQIAYLRGILRGLNG
jgi:uncharacterized damage-inducible protein DinB